MFKCGIRTAGDNSLKQKHISLTSLSVSSPCVPGCRVPAVDEDNSCRLQDLSAAKAFGKGYNASATAFGSNISTG